MAVREEMTGYQALGGPGGFNQYGGLTVVADGRDPNMRVNLLGDLSITESSGCNSPLIP